MYDMSDMTRGEVKLGEIELREWSWKKKGRSW